MRLGDTKQLLERIEFHPARLATHDAIQALDDGRMAPAVDVPVRDPRRLPEADANDVVHGVVVAHWSPFRFRLWSRLTTPGVWTRARRRSPSSATMPGTRSSRPAATAAS